MLSFDSDNTENAFPSLKNYVKQRMSKQFKDTLFDSQEAVNNDASVAMSLVDALQNWADALEAQISMMRGEVLELKTTNRQLSDDLTDLKSENVQLKSQVETLGTSFMQFKGEAKGVQEDIRVMSSSFGDFIDHFNDFTVSVTVNFTRVNKSMEVMKENVLHLEENETIENLQQKINDNENGIAQMLADNKALNANVQLILYNASMAFFSDFEDLRGQAKDFEVELEIIKANQKSLANETELIRDQVVTSLEVIQHEVVASQAATEEKMKPILEALNKTMHDTLGKMEMNVTKLNMKDEGIKQDVFRLNSMVSGNVNALQTQANMTLSMQEQMLNMATSLNDLQGTVENSTHAFALGLQHLTEMSSYNSSLLQRGFFGLEKHFIETKRKIFETQLQLVSVNSTLKTIGDLRAEVLVIGQSMANTTMLVTDRFDDISSTNMALQDSLARMWNMTDQLDSKLAKLQNNHTYVSGIFETGLKDFATKQDQIETDMEQKILNKTINLETGLGSLLNYTLALDTKFMTIKSNLTKVNRKIEKGFELYELQGKRVSENANVIKENITNLGLAANILEAELSRVASSYAGLKNALSRHISNTGNIEVNVQKLVTESIHFKGELDSIKFDMAGVKAEATGVSVFVTSMQNHIGDLTNNITMANNNITKVHRVVEFSSHSSKLVMVTFFKISNIKKSYFLTFSNTSRFISTPFKY